MTQKKEKNGHKKEGTFLIANKLEIGKRTANKAV